MSLFRPVFRGTSSPSGIKFCHKLLETKLSYGENLKSLSYLGLNRYRVVLVLVLECSWQTPRWDMALSTWSTHRRATAADELIRTRPVESHNGARGNILVELPKHFHGAFPGRTFLNFSFQNGTFWHTLYFWPTAPP